MSFSVETVRPVEPTGEPAFAAVTPPPAGLLRALGVRAVVLTAILKLHVIEARRYALNTVMGLVLSYVLFLTLFLGVRMSAGDVFGSGDTLPAIVVGLVVWLLALRAFRGVSGRLSAEAAQGTLEQLALSPLGLGRILVYQAVVQFAIQFFMVAVLLLLIMATTGRWLHVDLASILPLLLLTVAGAQGIGFAMGGLALIYKRVTAVFLLFQYLFIAFIAIPIDSHPVVRWLPLAWGSHLIREVMVDGTSILQLPPTSLGILAATAVAYFGLGFGAFRLCEGAARERGLLGHY